MKDYQVTTHSRLVDSPGWDACVEARLLKSSDPWEQAPEFRSSGHALRRLFKDVDMDALVCVDGRPTVCIKDGRALQDPQVEETRRKLWNLGATTLFVVERPGKVEVFSTFARPSKDDSQGERAKLGSETIESLEATELALRVRELVRRVETGAVYRDHRPLFNPKDAVDRSLLENLKAARNLISPQISLEGYRRAHALIGRFLFSCYLLDRGIIGPAYLKGRGLPEANDMMALLDCQRGDRAQVLNSLFQALQQDFNGSLFVDHLDMAVLDPEIGILRRFLSGEDLQSGQMALFKLYDFSFIPVELISSIYQEFLGAEAAAEAEPAIKNRPPDHGQRRQGAYYTPTRLAELTIDVATQDWDTLLDKRCLDPACGSGVFLVILFVRMAEEWRKRHPKAKTKRRYDAMMRLLSENLCGTDINLTACLVTCFSLYLAFLDQMEPKEITELREALERDRRSKLLPRILWKEGEVRSRPPHFDSIRELDFFKMEAKAEFDLIIGNPPWVSRKKAPSAETWLYSEKLNPIVKGIRKSERSQTLFPARELASAFMWKAGRHVRDTGRICQVLPSRVLLDSNTDRFQAEWVKRHRLESVWLLADYRFILFPGANCPCFIGRYHPRREGEALGEFEFVTPKVEWLDPREATIPVQPEDQKVLRESEIIRAAERGEAAVAWKQHHWGTPRDARLIERLTMSPRLNSLVTEPPRGEEPGPEELKSGRKWWKGQGFKPFSEASYARAPERYGESKKCWWNPSWLYLPATKRVLGLVLAEDECEVVGHRFEKLHRSPDRRLFEAPMLLINQGCTKFLFSDFNVLFQHAFQSICAPKHEEDELLFLTAYLASPLAQYILFHTTANIGIERDKALLNELMALPFPLPEDTPNPQRSQGIIRNCAELLRRLRRELLEAEVISDPDILAQETKRKLIDQVYDYFSVCPWERYLIEDTVGLFRPSSTPGSLDSRKLFTAQPSRPSHRQGYAETLISVFRGWTRTKANLWAEGCVAPRSGLALVTLSVGGRAKPYRESEAEERVEELLERIRESSTRTGGAAPRYLRGFAFYEGKRVHLLKPLGLRHWTRTAALNDADEIIARMMEEDGWGV